MFFNCFLTDHLTKIAISLATALKGKQARTTYKRAEPVFSTTQITDTLRRVRHYIPTNIFSSYWLLCINKQFDHINMLY